MPMEMNSPAVTFMLQYTEANSGFVDYTNRSEAVKQDQELALETHRQEIEGLTEEQVLAMQAAVPELNLNFRDYLSYMNRSYATENQSEELTAIFTADANYLQRSKVNELKENLETACQNGSLLWQGVISFDNAFLAQQGLYDIATGQVDQQAIKSVIRDALPKVIAKEGLSDSSFWWANIHLNTENIHVHFGLSELQSAREKIFYQPRGRMEYKGNFSQKTISKLKSDVFHGLLNDQTRKRLIRKEQILANLKSNLVDQVFHNQQVTSSAEKNFLEQAYNHLPLQKNWRYGSNAKDFAVSKFFLDKYIDSYLQNEGKELYQEFMEETRNFLGLYDRAYLAGKNQTYERVRKVNGQTVRSEKQAKGYDLEGVIHRRELELIERLGNRILRSFKEAAPQIEDVQLEKNLPDFSKGNQKRILQQFPEASYLKSLAAWEKKGYSPKEGMQPIEIIKPVYKEYDKHGNGIGEMSFETSYVYDIKQMEENILTKRLSLKELSLFSSAELQELVDAAKKKENQTEKERQELGTFRYALKLSKLEERQKALLVSQKLLHQVQPLRSDQPFLQLKQERLATELKLVELQLTPNYRLSKSELELKQSLSRQFVESVNLPISKADRGTIQLPIRHLQSELEALKPLQDEGILMLLKGYPISKQDYKEELETQISIFQVKHGIYKTNQKIAQTTDEAQIKVYKQFNAKEFSKLKELYGKLRPEEEGQKEALLQTVQKQIQSQKQNRRSTIQQTQGSLKVDTSFMRNLTASLNQAQRSSQKALMERARSDEREEKEERRENRR